jgi:hypothetical protein
MAHWSWIEDETPDPMLQEQFQLALDATQIRTPELIEACRSVMVDGQVATEVAQQRQMEPSNIYRAISTIKEKWDQICTEEDWEYVPLAFPRSIMKVMLEFQREQLSQYRDQKDKRGGRKGK